MATVKIDFDREIFNAVYLPFLHNESRFEIFYGGAGSGKSQFIAQRAIARCLKEKYYRLIFSRKIAKTIRNSQYLLFKDLITSYGLSSLFDCKESTMEITCKNGNMMMGIGMDDPEKVKSIQEPSEVWCEEATEYDLADILQLNLRLRTKKARYNQVTLSFNPISRQHWMNEYFFQKESDCKILKTTYKDNNFLPEEYRNQLEELAQADMNYYNVYALGLWGEIAKGLIYPKYTLVDMLPDGCDVIYGLDFGYTNPTTLVKIGVKENDLYIDELLYQPKLTNTDLIARLKDFGISKNEIYADCAEPQRIEEIYRTGINIKPANKSVKDGIERMQRMNIHITKGSANIIKEIQQYKWKEDKNGNSLEEPVKFLDHALDACRYAVATHLFRHKMKKIF